MSGGIFISYRREDAPGFAGRIYDRLAASFGSENLFIDVDNIDPGLDFAQVLSDRVGSCDVLIAIIGNKWAAITDKRGRRRLESADDFVRIEVEAALDRKVVVIPVLVDGAQMPDIDDLSGNLRALARRNAVEISHTRFHSDSERLIRALRRLMAERADEDLAKSDAARISEEQRQAEAVRIAEEERRAEAVRIAEEERRAEAVRIAEEERRAETARIAEEEQRQTEALWRKNQDQETEAFPTRFERIEARTSRRRLFIILTIVLCLCALFSILYKYKSSEYAVRPAPDVTTKPARNDEGEPSGSDVVPKKPAQDMPVPVVPENQPSGLVQVRRAALLVEAPGEPNKVKTFVGSVVWKLNNSHGADAAASPSVEADIELPDDKLKVTVVFEKNSEASLPASHTIKIRFDAEPGSYSGNVKQISVPQMRPEASPNGEPLMGVTVQIVPNAFLVGLSPGNAEAANTDLMRRLQWVDIPILLHNGKIAKLTFEKGEPGQRDLNEAFEAWRK